MQCPAHLEALCQSSLELIGDLLGWYGKSFQFPFDAHEEHLLLRIHMLIEINNVAVVGVDEVGDRGNEAVPITAMDQKRGGAASGVKVFSRHGLLLVRVER